jgi:DNA topoisomerase-1
MITAAIGKFGPYILHDGKYANVESAEDVLTIGINRAVTVLAEKKQRGGRPEQKALKDLGAHPDDGLPIKVMNGRFGPYVSYNKVFATVPRGTDPQSVTLEQALQLIADKVAKGPSPKGGRFGKKAAPKAEAAPKTAKAPAKKPAKAKKKAAA